MEDRQTHRQRDAKENITHMREVISSLGEVYKSRSSEQFHMPFPFRYSICVRHYAGRKILDVSVAQPKTLPPQDRGPRMRHFGNTPPRQLNGHIVAQEVARDRDTPNFCVSIISDIYQIFREMGSNFCNLNSIWSLSVTEMLYFPC